MVPWQYFYPRVVFEFYQTMTSREEKHPTALHFSVDGSQGVLLASDIAAAFGLPMALANFADYRQWPHPSPRDMVRLLSRDTSAGTILLRRQLPPGMIFVDHVLRSNFFSFSIGFRGEVPSLRHFTGYLRDFGSALPSSS